MRNKGIYAQHFHITPEKGLLNDPNGLCYFDGYYHVFYQYNPYHTDHSIKYWGHLRSKNMKHWEQLPIALKSDDWFDKDGVYSGSAIVHQGILYLFYTGNTKDEKGIRTSYQCLATSTDGIHFKKYGPILEQADGFTGHVRDPKVWYDRQLDGWWMLLGAQRTDRTGDTIAYYSDDLMNWQYKGSIFQFDQPYGYMWECPDLIFLTDEITNEEKAVFIVSPQGIEADGYQFNNIFNTIYLVGQWDNQKGCFIADNQMIREIDRGFEFYAPQTFVAPDGRVIQYAWEGTMWPEVEKAVPTHQDHWIHQLSMPRSLHLKNGKLYQLPLKEQLQLVNTRECEQVNNICLDNATRIQLTVEDDASSNLELVMDQEVLLHYDSKQRLLTIIRTNWLTHQKEWRAVTLSNDLIELDIWMDTSSIEVFINHGEETFSLRYFAKLPLSHLSINTESKLSVVVGDIQSYQYSQLD